MPTLLKLQCNLLSTIQFFAYDLRNILHRRVEHSVNIFWASEPRIN